MSENAQTNQRMLLAIVTGPDSENVENALVKGSLSLCQVAECGITA